MRFMMFMIPDIYQGAEAAKLSDDFAPPAEAVAAMMKYNEELADAGVLLSLEGLKPPSVGVRVRFSHGERIVTDGPFAESREVVGGFWMIRANSLREAVEWAKRCPAQDACTIEVRQVAEVSEWPDDVQNAAHSPTVRAQLERAHAA